MTVPPISATRMSDVDHTATSSSKPLLILGTSLGTSTILWDAAGALLQDSFTIIKWDLPGHGISRPANAPFSLAELADAVIALADEEGAAQFYYAGVSLGGAVGVELALRHPDRLAALAVICSSAKFGQSSNWMERAEQVRTQGTPSMVNGSALRWFGPDFIATNPAVASALLHSLSDADDESYALCCEVLAHYDARDRLGEITVPTVAISGEYDQVSPAREAELIAEGVRHGSAILVAGAGHLAPAEQPEQIATLLIEFFANGSKRSETMSDHRTQPDRTDRQRYDDGMTVRREVLGDAHVDRANAGITDLTVDFQNFITRYAWGDIWSRPGLDRKTRSVITITALIAHGHFEELAMHIRAAITNGLTPDEITEVLLQTGVYCGVPAANTAFKIAQEVLAEALPRH